MAIAQAPLRFGNFELHPAERVLRVDGEPMVLGGRAFDLLLVLAERHDRLVTKQELLDLVWPGLVVEENNIATQISTLRKLLGTNAIATIPGYGYRLTAALQPTPGAGSVSTPTQPPRHNLPEQRTRFIGREAALLDLARLLPATRLLTLTGIGGCGKTRLALQFAKQQLAAFADGVWFIDLAPLKHAERVVAACAAGLGVTDEGDAPLMERLLGHLAARRTLLVLDNCEHVIDGVGGLMDALLERGGKTTILATSRETLGIGGEQIYPVRSLSLPATPDLQTVLGAESVRVFADRARLVLPDFEIDDCNAEPIVEICRRLDGIALAIELAAARVAMLPVTEIAERLDDRFRLLTGGSRALPRHQTLHAAMQWSYEQLAPQEQLMLRQMSVFVGGWTLQGAADVAQTADEYEALALLTALHDKSLLVVDRGAANGQPRYRMLETVRQYALDRLNDCGEGQAARDRHVAHYVALAQVARQHEHGPGQDAWISRFRHEHENLIAALTWCGEGPGDPPSGLRLAAATNFYWVWNAPELGHRLVRAVLERALTSNDDALARTDALNAIARLSLIRGRYEEAQSYARQGLAAARRIDAKRQLARVLCTLGSALKTLGGKEEGLRCLEEALELARGLGDARLVARLLNNIAGAKHVAAEFEVADRCYREALEIARAHSGRLEIAILLDNLIRLQVAQGRSDEARLFAIECLPLARDDKVGVDLLEATIGLASCRGEHELAARLHAVAAKKVHEWGYEHEPSIVEHTAPWIARSHSALGDAAFEAAEAAGRMLDFDAAMLELRHWLQREA
jgi:predicted ATPase/DNA-binding winged helix-turn-helix (wHTH) protein